MNRIFKTKWSDSHKQYVVTDENHSNKGKTAKSAVTMAVSALMLVAGAASATYMEPGFKAQDAAQMGQAKTSWETAEYQKNWGLSALKASTAYALGFHAQSVKVGMMDSGILTTHKELSGDRWHTLMDALHKTQENIRRVINSPLTALIKLESMIIMGQDARVSMPAIGTVPVCMALPGDLTFIRPIPADRMT